MPERERVMTPKKEKFAQNVFMGMSNIDAYTDAYEAQNQKRSTRGTQACYCAKDPLIIARIQELRDELKERNMVTVENVLKELSKIAFDDIKNHLSFRTEKVVVDYEENTPIFEYRTIVDVKDSDDVDTRAVAEVSTSKGGVFKFRMYDKEQALLNIGKYLGMFNDKVELTGKEGGPIVVEEAREKLVARITKLSEYKSDRKGDSRSHG